MPINGLNVGRDVVVTFNDNNGNVVTNRVKEFNSRQKTSNRETVSLDGINRHINIPMGWEGTFQMERNSRVIDDYFFNLENTYYSGQNVGTITITETITESDGSTSQWQYVGCVITLDDAGSWKGDDYVTQKVNFSSQQRNRIS